MKYTFVFEIAVEEATLDDAAKKLARMLYEERRPIAALGWPTTALVGAVGRGVTLTPPGTTMADLGRLGEESDGE